MNHDKETLEEALDELERVATITSQYTDNYREKVEVSANWAIELVRLGRIAIESQSKNEENANLKVERERIREKLKLVRQSLIHSECWAPGPTTGNYYEDFIVCPGCKGIAILDELLGEK